MIYIEVIAATNLESPPDLLLTLFPQVEKTSQATSQSFSSRETDV
jgi:hypothetical protein